MGCTVTFNEKSIDQLKSYEPDVRKLLFSNFIDIAKRFNYPDVIDSFEGKFKPSWECEFAVSMMRASFLELAEEFDLHHYHFGYKFYKDGNDPKYDGKVSDGIIHFRVINEDGFTEFRIIEVCLEHPSPFKIPFNNVHDCDVLAA